MSSTLTGLPFAALPLANADLFYVVQGATGSKQVSGSAFGALPVIANMSGALRDYSNTGAKVVTFNVVTDPVYLVTPSDAFNTISMSGTTTQQVILPSGTAFANGTQILVERYGTGVVNIGATGGVVFQSRSGVSGLAAQFSVGTIILRNSTTWLGAGDLV